MRRSSALWVVVAFCVLVATVVFAWLFMLDTAARRRMVSARARRMAEEARQHPDDPRYARRLLSMARSSYSFEATVATVALGEIGEAAIPVIDELAGLIQSPDGFIAREAASSLAKLGPLSEPALDALVKQVERGDPDDDTTWFSAEAIGRIGHPARKFIPLLRLKIGQNEIFDGRLREAIERLEAD